MLLPSPTTSDANGAGAHGTGEPDLRTALAEHLMPTPRAGDGEEGGPNQRGSSGDLMLPSAVTTLPTPTARDWKNVGDPDKTAGRMDERGQPLGEVVVNSLLPTPMSQDAKQSTIAPSRADRNSYELSAISALLPTPAVNDMGAAYTPETWDDEWTARMKAAHNNGNGHGDSLNIEAQRLDLLPTPERADGSGGRQSAEVGGTRPSGAKRAVTLATAVDHAPSRWGKYAAAIARWEAATRPAPEPTNITEGYLKARAKRLARLDRRPVGRRGSLKIRRQLAAAFSEWMMGVPRGWITDVPGITRNEALKAAGNGVVPQQAAEGLRYLLDMPTGRQIADAYVPDDLFELLAETAAS